ncbi:hypothetical protein V8E55_003987 [Tylopilus felleus]
MTAQVPAPRDVQITLNYHEPQDQLPYTYFTTDLHPVTIHDTRGNEDTFGIWRIKTVYYAEVEEILRKYPGAWRVFVLDHNNPQMDPTRLAPRGPVVSDGLPDNVERLLKGRYQFFFFFESIYAYRQHRRLGIADYRSIDLDADLVLDLLVRLIFPKRQGETHYVRYNPEHKWYYLSDQTPHEVLLIKCFDSDSDKARLAPH